MGKINWVGIAEIEAKSRVRRTLLAELTSVSFNLDNTTHIHAIKQYTDEFELAVNQMYLAQALHEALYLWGILWMLGYLLPIPEFIISTISTFIYFGIAALLFEKYNSTDFSLQVQDMRLLYNWCLKNNHEVWPVSHDNTAVLSHPDVQRMIKLLAPLTSTEFMIAWTRVLATPTAVQQSAPLKIWSVGRDAVGYIGSFFGSTAQTDPDQTARIQKIKKHVESRDYDLSVTGGLDHATRYFLTHEKFRQPILTKVSQIKSMFSMAMRWMESNQHNIVGGRPG